MEIVGVNLVVEGPLDERVLRRLIGQSNCRFNAGPCYGIGRNYVGRLGYFVDKIWSVETARQLSRSLHKAVVALERFRPRT